MDTVYVATVEGHKTVSAVHIDSTMFSLQGDFHFSWLNFICYINIHVYAFDLSIFYCIDHTSKG